MYQLPRGFNSVISTPVAFFLIMGIFIYLSWNNFELPTIFIGETTEVKGKVVDIKIRYGARRGYIQNVEYVYKVKDKYFLDKIKVGNNFGWQNVGNRVLIEYKESNPQKNKVVGFYDDFSTKASDEIIYISGNNSGYYQIRLLNRLLYYTEFANKGIIKEELVGEYKTNNDTLFFEPYSFIEKKVAIKIKYLVLEDSIGNKQLVDILKRNIYKQISTKK